MQIFLGGLPYHFDEVLCRQLLEPFGELQSFELVRDREKGDSKGYGFAVFAKKEASETAIVGLNGLNLEGRILTCRQCALLATAPFGLTCASVPAVTPLCLRAGRLRAITVWAVG